MALVLGAFAASDVSRREKALRTAVGAPVSVVVATDDIEPGERLQAGDVSVREVPRRFAPRQMVSSRAQAIGKLTRVAIPAGSDLTVAVLDNGSDPVLGPDERISDVVAMGDPAMLRAGGKVDLLVTGDDDSGASGRSRLALKAAEIIHVEKVDPPGGSDSNGSSWVRASLRVTVDQAVELATDQSFASAMRLLPVGSSEVAR